MLLLTGKTRKGKNRVRELGDRWEILRTKETVSFSDKKGEWALITPVWDKNQVNSRWISLENDENFNIDHID